MAKQYDESTLPKWAREGICKLRAEVQARDRTIDELRSALSGSGTEETPVRWDDLRAGSSNYLPEHASVRFMLTGGSVDVAIRDDELRIVADGQLAISPAAANLVTLSVKQ